MAPAISRPRPLVGDGPDLRLAANQHAAGVDPLIRLYDHG